MPDGGNRFTADIARRAFDTVADIQRVETLEELDVAVRSSFQSLGFDVWVGFDSVQPDGQSDVKVIFGQTHVGWEEHYKTHGFDKHDVMIRASLLSDQPFFWSDATSRLSLSAQEMRVMNEAGEFRLREGFITPMRNLDGSITSVLLTGENLEVGDPDLRVAAHLLSVYFGSVGRQLLRSNTAYAARPALLTQRQIDCLCWVREGKSSTDIAEILGLSVHTVRGYVKSACQRLGVRTRVQAVTEAAVRGLIKL